MRGEDEEVGGPALARAVKAIRAQLALNQRRFGEAVGLSQQQISKIERGISVHTRNLAKIAEIANCRVADLLTDNSNTWPGPIAQRSVPVLSLEEAGEWEAAVQRGGMNNKNIAFTTYAVSAGAYALVVQGDSMVSSRGGHTYPPGCTIIVDPNIPPAPGRRVVYRLPGDLAATFKQLETDGRRQWLKPLNDRYPIIELPAGAKYCGTVVQTMISE